MNTSRMAVLFAAAILALSAAGCGDGSSVSTQSQVTTQQPLSPQPPALQPQALMLSPSGGTFPLRLPAGYSGSLTFGPNHAPQGTVMELGIASALLAQRTGEKSYTTSLPSISVKRKATLPEGKPVRVAPAAAETAASILVLFSVSMRESGQWMSWLA